MRYFAFGSCIESEYDLGPLPLVEDGPVAVTLTFSTATKLAVPPIKKLHSYLAQARNINIYADGQELCLQVEDFIQFYFDWKRQVISCFMTQYAGKLLIYYWILQQALPIYLLLSNRVELLHAGAVVMDGSVVGFLADPALASPRWWSISCRMDIASARTSILFCPGVERAWWRRRFPTTGRTGMSKTWVCV